MAQVCRNCGHAGIDDSLDRCPNCSASLMYTELPPRRRPARDASPGVNLDLLEANDILPPDRVQPRRRTPPEPATQPVERPQPRPEPPPREERRRKPPPRVQAPQGDRIRDVEAAEPYEVTERPRGPNARKTNIPALSYVIELFAQDDWVPLFQMVGMDRSPSFGRSHKMLEQGMETMAEKHVRFRNTAGGLLVEALDSLNGVYLQITRPLLLTDGTRFRIGDYVLEFRDAEPVDPAAPAVGDDGERFVAQDVVPLAYLEFIRPDNRPGARFPILKRTSTVLGKGGRDQDGSPRHVDVPLRNDKLVSGRHAEIRFVDDHFVLEDLKSLNGTFVRVSEPTHVGDGAILCLGRIYLRVTQIQSIHAH
jgi:FHA domain